MIKKSSILGGMLLIAGSCIGAGMLGLPVVTGLAGFFPSFLVMIIAWAFMTFTALLLVEITGWFDTRVNIITMIGKGLGKPGKILSGLLYLFLFYGLLIGYVSISGSLFSTFIQKFFSFALPEKISSLFFVLLFGVLIYMGTKAVDLCNRLLMVGLVFCYIFMVIFSFPLVQGENLLFINNRYVLFSLPILITSFGFHNMIPTIAHYLHHDLKKIKLVVLGGSCIALCIYLLWNLVVLGIISSEGEQQLLQAYLQGKEATSLLKKFIGNKWLFAFAKSFGFFAITTSFIAQGLALVHFIGDGLKVSIKKSKWYLCILALFPPAIIGLSNPEIFYTALGFAGGICAVLLFGLLPALVVLKGRYIKKPQGKYQVSGGLFSLFLIMTFSLFVVIFEIFRLL